MNRREFLISSLATPLFIRQLLANQDEISAKYYNATDKSFEFLEVKGSYNQIGYQIGKYFGKNIKQVIKQRAEWHNNLLSILKSPPGQLRSAEYLRLTEKHFPHILEEILGMADGAGLHFDAIWAMCIKSELGALDEEPDGCSTIFTKDQQHMWLFHNEDGHDAYRDIMFILKATPPSGVTYLSLVYPGIITGNGPSMNNQGIIQTTNYIGSTESEVGFPRYILGRAVLEAKSLKEAMDIITMEPRAYPYHHNLGSLSEKKYISLETTPAAWQSKEPQENYCHTNHLLFEKTNSYKAEDLEYRQTSSISRFKVIQEALPDLPTENVTPGDFLEILASHQSSPYSPCRHPQGEVMGRTLGTAYYNFEKGSLRLFRGNPCQSLQNDSFMDFQFDEL